MSVQKKIIILYVTKNLVSFLDMKNIRDKRENGEFDYKWGIIEKRLDKNS